MPFNIRLIRDQVLVRQDLPQSRLQSGLYLPQGHRDLQEDYATVIDVGPGNKWPIGVKPGDRVLFKRRPSSALIPDPREGGREDWVNLLILREEDIIGVIGEDV